MLSHRLRAAPLAVLCALTGCKAGGSAATHPAPPLPGTEACIFTADLYDWTVLDDSNLIVYAPGQHQPYLIKLFAPVFDLPFHERIGFEAVEHNGQLCKGDFVIVRGDMPSRTAITNVRLLSAAQAKDLIAASRHATATGAAHP